MIFGLSKEKHASWLAEITDYISYSCNKSIISKYLERIEEELTIHPHLPAQTIKGVRHSNKHNVVHPKHKHQHKRGFGKLPEQREMKMFCQLKGQFIQKLCYLITFMTLQTCMNFFSLWQTKTDIKLRSHLPLYSEIQWAKCSYLNRDLTFTWEMSQKNSSFTMDLLYCRVSQKQC